MKRLLASLLAVALAAMSANPAIADAVEDILKKGTVRIATPLDVPPLGSQHDLLGALGSQSHHRDYDGEIDRLHQQWLGMKLAPLPTL